MKNLMKKTSLSTVATQAQLAALVVSTFIANATNVDDVNQLAFNTVIAETLKTHTFADDFEKLLVRVDFNLAKALSIISPDSYECVFDAYVETTGDGDYQDISLVGSTMHTLMERSNLLRMIVSQAYDFDQSADYNTETGKSDVA